MNIFFFTETQTGCYKWRAAIPAKYLQRRGHNVQVYERNAKAVEAPDVIVFFRTYGVVKPMMEWCKSRGIRVVYDTDDALDLVPRENVNYHEVLQQIAKVEYMLQHADIVTTTTKTLAEHLRRSNPNVVVVPNTIDPEEWTVAQRGDQVRVGWTGSSTHFVDLSVALDAVADLQRQYKFEFVIQGITPSDSVQALYDQAILENGKLFRDSPVGKAMKWFLNKAARLRIEFHSSVPVADHAAKVADLRLDIGIAPLVDDAFNRNKSCIKYYEYAMSGAVTLASNVLPYSEEVSITCKNSQRHWKDKLAFLLEADRNRLWLEQRDWVLSHRNIEQAVELWEQALQPQATAVTAA